MDAYYRFIFVGRYDGLPRYYAQIRALLEQYEMLPDRFWFTGPVPDDDLAAFYRWADAYVSLSEHEGFCVPLVEAMASGTPRPSPATTHPAAPASVDRSTSPRPAPRAIRMPMSLVRWLTS